MATRVRAVPGLVALVVLGGVGGRATPQEGDAGRPAYAQWISDLGHADWERRIRAAWSLAAYRPAPAAAVQPLIAAIFEDPPEIGRRRANPGPHGYVESSDPEVRDELAQRGRLWNAATAALTGIGAPAAGPLLDALLAPKRPNDAGGYAVHNIHAALSGLKTAAVSALAPECQALNPARRALALRCLEHAGLDAPALRPFVERALIDAEFGPRWAAVSIVAARPDLALDDAAAVDALFAEPREFLARDAVAILARRKTGGAEHVARLVAALAVNWDDERRPAIEALATLAARLPEARSGLLQALAHGSELVRWKAAEGLGRIAEQDPSLLPALVACLADRSWQVRHAVLSALARPGLARLELAEPILSSAADPTDGREAGEVDALVAIGAPIVPRLLSLLADNRLREVARRALAGTGAAAVPALAALQDDPRQAELATEALLQMEPPPANAAGLLARTLASARRDHRVRAALALQRLGRAAAPAIPALVAAVRRGPDARPPDDRPMADREIEVGSASFLDPEDTPVRRHALDALVAIGTAAIPALVTLLDADDGDIVTAAATALGGIGPPAAAGLPALRARAARGAAAQAAGVAAVRVAGRGEILDRQCLVLDAAGGRDAWRELTGSRGGTAPAWRVDLDAETLRSLAAEEWSPDAFVAALRARIRARETPLHRHLSLLAAIETVPADAWTEVARFLCDSDPALRGVALAALALRGADARVIAPLVVASTDQPDAEPDWPARVASALWHIDPGDAFVRHGLPVVARHAAGKDYAARRLLDQAARSVPAALDAVAKLAREATEPDARLDAAECLVRHAPDARVAEFTETVVGVLKTRDPARNLVVALAGRGPLAAGAAPAILDALAVEPHNGFQRTLLEALHAVLGR